MKFILPIAILSCTLASAQPASERDSLLLKKNKVKTVEKYMLHQLDLEDSTAGSLSETYTYNRNGQMTSMDNVVNHWDYYYNKAGQLERALAVYSKKDTQENYYHYDEKNHLIAFETYRNRYKETAAKYEYDAAGNKITYLEYGPDTVQRRLYIYKYNSKNQLIYQTDINYHRKNCETFYTYDAAGNIKTEDCTCGADKRKLYSPLPLYDDKKRKVKEIFFNNDGSVQSVRYNTWKDDQLVYQRLAYSDSSRGFHSRISYYPNDLTKDIITESFQEENRSKETYNYNDRGKMIKKSYWSRDTVRYYILYEYTDTFLTKESSFTAGKSTCDICTLYVYTNGRLTMKKVAQPAPIQYSWSPVIIKWGKGNTPPPAPAPPLPKMDTLRYSYTYYPDGKMEAEYREQDSLYNMDCYLQYVKEPWNRIIIWDYNPCLVSLVILDTLERKSSDGTGEFRLKLGVYWSSERKPKAIIYRTITTLANNKTIITDRDSGGLMLMRMEQNGKKGSVKWITNSYHYEEGCTTTIFHQYSYVAQVTDSSLFDNAGNKLEENINNSGSGQKITYTYRNGKLQSEIHQYTSGYKQTMRYHYLDTGEPVSKDCFDWHGELNYTEHYQWQNGRLKAKVTTDGQHQSGTRYIYTYYE